jgi:hypothetical protein
MSISRTIVSFIVALGVFSMSFAPAPVYNTKNRPIAGCRDDGNKTKECSGRPKTDVNPPPQDDADVNPPPQDDAAGSVLLILANRTFGPVSVEINGKVTGGGTVSYSWVVGEGWNVYNLQPGKYWAVFYGCNQLTGRKTLTFSKGVKQIKVKLCCPSQNKPPHKIWIRAAGK